MFDPGVGEITVDTGELFCRFLKFDTVAEEDGKRLWDDALKRVNLEHEREGWFKGAKAKALHEMFCDG